MELEKSISLQKQVRQNADTLQCEFLDMKNWEQQMKSTDEKLRSSGPDGIEMLPPIRRKKMISRAKSKRDNTSKSQRIKSYDYSTWDRFDVDKACEEIDKETESEDSGEELLSREELEERHKEATKHKVMGNKYVKEQKWESATACYSEAIRLFPYDAVFYANRALCHLKMSNLFSAESDCTAAIHRDQHYVKAYHRRATARMALKQYAEAVQDLEKLLTFEQDNKEAKRMLIAAKEGISKSQVIALSKVSQGTIPKLPIEKKSEKPTITLKVVDVHKLADDSSKGDLDEGELLKISQKEGAAKHADWLPDIEDNVEEVKVINKLPHQKSKTPLRSVPIVTQSASELPTTSTKSESEVPQTLGNNSQVSSLPSEKWDLPAPPRTAVQFLMHWNKHKSSDYRYQYLKLIPAEAIPKMFQDSLESNTFSEILNIVIKHFDPHKDPIFDYLKHFTEINRFRMLTMFMSTKEKKDLQTLFDSCRTSEGRSEDDWNFLRSKYEL